MKISMTRKIFYRVKRLQGAGMCHGKPNTSLRMENLDRIGVALTQLWFEGKPIHGFVA